MFYAVLTPLLPYYAQHLGLSKSAAGLLSAFYAFGAVAFSVPAGFLVSRIGARQTVVAGVACLWSGGLAWLMASAEPSRRSEVVGAVLGVGIAGALLGPVLGALAT